MKQKFEVKENETISDCLERMQKEGFVPIRRQEEPVFREVVEGGKKTMEVCGRKIIFIGEK